MKVAPLSYNKLIEKAKEAEGTGDNTIAMSDYQKAIKLQPANPFAYNRLMIIYRKQKMYKEELQLINEAINNIQNASNAQVSKFKSTSNIAKLSNALMKSTGLIDKNGKRIFEPEPIPTWKKREETVIKRIKKKRN